MDSPSNSTKDKSIEKQETEKQEEVTFSDLTYDPNSGTMSGKVKNNTDYFIDSVGIEGTLEEHNTNGYGEDETQELSFSNLGNGNVRFESYGICHIEKGEEKDFAFKSDSDDKDYISQFSNPKINTSKTVITYRGKEDDDTYMPVYLAKDSDYKMELTKNEDGYIEGITIENTSEYQWEKVELSLERYAPYDDEFILDWVWKNQINKGATITFSFDDLRMGDYGNCSISQILKVTFSPRAQ